MQLRSIDFKPGLRLVASTHMDPPEAEWDAMVQTVRRNDVPGYRILVITDGGSPNLKQRRAIDAAMTERKIHARSGVISASPSMRALMSAVNWIARNDLRAFRPDQVQEAFGFLELTPAEIISMQRGIEDLSTVLNLQLFKKVRAS